MTNTSVSDWVAASFKAMYMTWWGRWTTPFLPQLALICDPIIPLRRPSSICQGKMEGPSTVCSWRRVNTWSKWIHQLAWSKFLSFKLVYVQIQPAALRRRDYRGPTTVTWSTDSRTPQPTNMLAWVHLVSLYLSALITHKALQKA